jgi:hypothetical protein
VGPENGRKSLFIKLQMFEYFNFNFYQRKNKKNQRREFKFFSILKALRKIIGEMSIQTNSELCSIVGSIFKNFPYQKDLKIN